MKVVKNAFRKFLVILLGGERYRKFRDYLRGHSDFVKEYNLIISPEYYKQIHSLLHIAQIKDYNLKQIGNDSYGSYVMIDNLDNTSGIAYSFGIGGDVTWDEYMANNDYEVYMYDHTIENFLRKMKNFTGRE